MDSVRHGPQMETRDYPWNLCNTAGNVRLGNGIDIDVMTF